MIPYGRQEIDDDDVAAVVSALRSDWLTTGPEVEAFESELARACGARHAIAVANGTAALHCAYAAAGLQPGDEVLTSPLTFSATANMALAVGARPVFADIEPRRLCLDPDKAAAAVTARTRIIAPVDFAGHPAQLDAFMELARRHRLIVVEDAAHSLGSRFRGAPVGSIAHLTTMSFHPVKTITTAEGGAVLTNDDELAQRVRDFRNHGMIRDRARMGRDDGPWFYEVQSLGFNYRLSAIQCALGRSQLRKLDRFVRRRAEIVARYREAFAALRGIRLVEPDPDVTCAWHLFTVLVDGGAPARARFFAALQAQGIAPQVHYVAVNDLPLYRGLGYRPEDTPIAHATSQAIVSLPLFPAMRDDDVAAVIAAVRGALAA